MHFGFDDQQVAFRDAVRTLLDKECPPAVVRAAGDPAQPLDRALWDRLDGMGALAMLAPAGRGGLGLDERSLVLVLEETGRAALPHPVVETAAVAAPLVPLGTPTAMVVSDLGGPHVPTARDADLLLLHDQAGGGLHLVERAAVDHVPVATVDRARRAATVRWQPEPGTLVTDDPDIVEECRDRGAWGTAAQLIGLGQRMLEMSVAYVSQRHQFGRPVGSFQAVKHHLAEVHKELEFARPAVHRAAHSLATAASTRARDVSMAKALASEAAWLAGRQALQCHGAVGYTVEHDLGLYLKRTWALAKAWGDAAWHRDRVGRALGL